MTAGQIVDQLLDHGGETNAGELVRNIGREVRNNPLPAMLIGAGLASPNAADESHEKSKTAAAEAA